MDAEQFQMLPGRGVWTVLDGKQIVAGNEELLAEHHVPLSPQHRKAAECCLKDGYTLIYLAVDGKLAGFLALSDTLRPEAEKMLRQVKEAGVSAVC